MFKISSLAVPVGAAILLLLVISGHAQTPVVSSPTVTEYVYDDLGRLESATVLGSSQTTYEYDESDNRVSKSVHVSLPADAVTISDIYIANKAVNGTSGYKLRADGYIEITQGSSFIYAGQTAYVTTTTATVRWLASHLSASDFHVSAILATPSGQFTSCTSGMYQTLHGGYGPSWVMTTNQSSGTKRCRVYIEIREVANPETIVGSAYITLAAGPAS